MVVGLGLGTLLCLGTLLVMGLGTVIRLGLGTRLGTCMGPGLGRRMGWSGHDFAPADPQRVPSSRRRFGYLYSRFLRWQPRIRLQRKLAPIVGQRRFASVDLFKQPSAPDRPSVGKLYVASGRHRFPLI